MGKTEVSFSALALNPFYFSALALNPFYRFEINMGGIGDFTNIAVTLTAVSSLSCDAVMGNLIEFARKIPLDYGNTRHSCLASRTMESWHGSTVVIGGKYVRLLALVLALVRAQALYLTLSMTPTTVLLRSSLL
jgi:hypothetical protein